MIIIVLPESHSWFRPNQNSAHSLELYLILRLRRAVRIKLFSVRVLCRASYRVLEYSTDTGSSYLFISRPKTNGYLVPHSSFEYNNGLK